MANSTYFPDSKSAQADWYTNMGKEFPSVSTALGFSAAETNAWVVDCQFAAYLLVQLPTPITSFAQAVTGYVATLLAGTKDGAPVPLPEVFEWPPNDLPAVVAPGIDGRRQRTVDRLKASPNYTPLVIGKLLRTENTGAPFNRATFVGVIRTAAQTSAATVSVAFGKAGGHLDGVNLYRQRAGDAAPVKVGQFTHSPALDTASLKAAGVPEERSYTVVGVVADQEIGQPSPAVTVVVK